MRLLWPTLILSVVLLSGCGFHLRGDIPGTTRDKTLLMTGVSRGNPLYINFTQALTAGGGIVAAKSADASAVVNVMRAVHLRRPITLSAAGRANMFDLTYRVVYDVLNTKGEVLIGEKELLIHREYFNTQGSPLGQGYEEIQMRAEMEKEAAQTLLRQVVLSLQQKAATSSAAAQPESGSQPTPRQ